MALADGSYVNRQPEPVTIKASWLGIDFSGNYQMWRAEQRKSNVWISTVQDENGRLQLCDVRRVQDLPGSGPPFERLASILRSRNFTAAGIDAPFSVPRDFVPNGTHRALIDFVSQMPLQSDRPFPSARAFVDQLVGTRVMLRMKPLRETEREWAARKVNVRSTLWNRARGGAAMTAACLMLLGKADCPIWPWERDAEFGYLVEAFPAAQLRNWNLPYMRYSGPTVTAENVRAEILDGLLARVDMGNHRSTLLKSADALDAVLCAFAAIAASANALVSTSNEAISEEGLIAVHR